MQSEVWKDITGFEGMYQVSDLGNVKTLSRVRATGGRIRERLMTPNDNGKGYLQIGLYKKGQYYKFRVHRLVMAEFIGVSDLSIDHINGVKADNRLVNLRYCTHGENMRASNHVRKNKSSRYVGVSWHKASGRWRSRVMHQGKAIVLGYFASEELAGQLYAKKVASLR